MGRASVEELAMLAAQGGVRAKVIAVASGKGGVGKTNVSANLAICLAASGKRVALFDADFGLANLDIVLGINSKYNLSHFIKGVKTLDEICQPACGGVDVVCGVGGLDSLVNMSDFARERIVQSLEQLADNYDVVVVDTAAGVGKNVSAFCMAADHTVLISTTEPTAITDVYTLLKTLTTKHYAGSLSLLVNMADSVADGKKVYRQIAMAASQFLNTKLNHAGVLVKDERVGFSVKRRQPVVLGYPRSAVSRSLMTIAARLSKVPVDISAGSGFFKKVVNWLF